VGEHFQSIVDRDATSEEAEQLASLVVDVLVKRGIIEADQSSCILGFDPGYPPGPSVKDVVTAPADSLRELWTNGLEVVTERNVFDARQASSDFVCDACHLRFSYEDVSPGWSDAIDEWYKGEGVGLFACPRCKEAKPITDWTFDPPWGFGNLGFTFWNWPPLRESFVEEITALLGHRTVLVAGKL